MSRLGVTVLIILAVGIAAMMGYKGVMVSRGQTADNSEHGFAFFRSTKSAVTAIRIMLRDEDWRSLARYYDLSASDIDRETLVSGEFFIRTERPEAAHPGDFWRYRHPFPPQFEYTSATPPDEAGIVTVRVSIAIEQGADQPVQQGWQEFRMRKSAEGFQVLPD